MGRCSVFLCLAFIVFSFNLINAQHPPRLNIPGAVLVQQARPAPFRQQQRLLVPESSPVPVRLRRPNPNAIQQPVIRPVVEENDEPNYPSSSSTFDDEVAKLGLSALQNGIRQADQQEEDPRPLPIQFRPERPVPILRQDIRESLGGPVPITRPVQHLRQQEGLGPVPRPLLRQPEEIQVPQRQPQVVRVPQPRQQISPQSAPQPIYRQPARVSPSRQQAIDDEDERARTRKPPVQILRKYRTDNPDGSITWGYENDDGTFKEEVLGNDCITRGKYGYVDPDGVKREYTYETGALCDLPEEEEEELVVRGKGQAQQQGQLASRNKAQGQQQQQQLRPIPYQQQN